MSYVILPTKVAQEIFSLSNYNAVRGNFMTGTPDILAAKGDMIVGAGADTATRLAAGPDDALLTPDAQEISGLKWQVLPAARAYNSANLTSTVSAWETLSLDSERFDTDGMHDGSNDTSRLTIPAGGAGLYLIGGNAKFQLSGMAGGGGSYGSWLSLRIVLNGSTIIARAGTYVTISATAISGACDILTLYALNAGDYVEMQRYAATSVPYGVLADANYSPEFWAVWQRRL